MKDGILTSNWFELIFSPFNPFITVDSLWRPVSFERLYEEHMAYVYATGTPEGRYDLQRRGAGGHRVTSGSVR